MKETAIDIRQKVINQEMKQMRFSVYRRGFIERDQFEDDKRFWINQVLYEDELEEEEEGKEENKFGAQSFILLEDSRVLKASVFLELITCFVSSFVYAWFSAYCDETLVETAHGFEIFFEFIFFISMVRKAFTLTPDETGKYRKKPLLETIADYLKGDFIKDLIPFLPITFVFLGVNKYFRYFYLLKVLRIINCLEMQFTQLGINFIKDMIKLNIENNIKSDPRVGEDIIEDHNKINQLLVVNYLAQTVQLSIAMTTLSYFFGIFWFIFTDLSAIYKEWDWEKNNVDLESINSSYFFKEMNMGDKSKGEQTIALTYFAFTTLSTVGFGDIYPYSDEERMFGAFMMLFGVMIFSMVMGTFTEILHNFKASQEEMGDQDHLTIFLSLLKKLNHDQDIDPDFKERIEKFFEYKWDKDRNQSLTTPEDSDLLEQLPFQV